MLFKIVRSKMFFPEISKEAIGQLIKNKNVFLGLTRLSNISFHCDEIQLSKGMKIVRHEKITSPWALEVRGEECWPLQKIKAYQESHGENQYETVNAYKGSSHKETRSLDYQCAWYGSDYYLEQVNPPDEQTETSQDLFSRETICALIAMSVVSEGRASSARQLWFIKFSGSEIASAVSGDTPNLPFNPRWDDIYHFDESSVGQLKKLTTSLLQQNHPEGYLAALRYFRSLSRRQPDDQIIDLMIGLEAMLSGSSDAGIALRISQRLSHLLGKEKKERREIREDIRKSYNFRSDLVHGNKRQTDFLEEFLSTTKKKATLTSEDTARVAMALTYLVRSAIFSRHVEHGEKSKADLYAYLDDLAI